MPPPDPPPAVPKRTTLGRARGRLFGDTPMDGSTRWRVAAALTVMVVATVNAPAPTGLTHRLGASPIILAGLVAFGWLLTPVFFPRRAAKRDRTVDRDAESGS